MPLGTMQNYARAVVDKAIEYKYKYDHTGSWDEIIKDAIDYNPPVLLYANRLSGKEWEKFKKSIKKELDAFLKQREELMSNPKKFGDYETELEMILEEIGKITKKYEVYVIGAYGNIQGSFDLELSHNIYYKAQERMENEIRRKWNEISNIPLNDIFYRDIA